MGGFLKFIFYFIVITWLLRKVLGYFFKGWMSSEMENFQKQQKANNQQQQQRRTGDVFISKKPQSKEVKSDKVGGDYVDYEEIKD